MKKFALTVTLRGLWATSARAVTITLLIILQITGFPFQDLVPVNAALAPIEVDWFFFEPAVIRTDATDSVDFKVKINGGPSSVQLELPNDTISLTAEGDGKWGITLTAAQALFGYQPDDDANHNFVGFLDVFSDGTRIERRNVFVNVLDQNIPDATILTIGPTVQISNHVVNIWKPDLDLEHGLPTSTITQQFYENLEDDFDFINLVFALPSFPQNRSHFAVQNNVEGIGLRLFNNAAVYGSNGRLQGITLFPIDSFFDLADTAAIHELGHQWINFLTLPILASGRPHWPISSLARGVMGFSIPPTQQGGQFPFNIVPLPNGNFQLQQMEPLGEFTDLDLYLIGLIPPHEVSSHSVFVNQNQVDQIHNGGILVGPVETVTVDDVIAKEGPRIPDSSVSQKLFRVATVIVTKERLLNKNEMEFFDHFAARGEAAELLPFSSGFAKGMTKPFFLATGGRASLITCIVAQCSREVAIDIRPCSDANKINPNSIKNINVAIFSANGFDATTVDPNTVRFGATGTEAAPIHVALRDINEDGLFDMVVRFQIQDTGIKCGNISAVLTGQISNGPTIIASSPITTVQCGN
jgi:hypothetical protein